MRYLFQVKKPFSLVFGIQYSIVSRTENTAFIFWHENNHFCQWRKNVVPMRFQMKQKQVVPGASILDVSMAPKRNKRLFRTNRSDIDMSSLSAAEYSGSLQMGSMCR